jgi:hypothetical protein
MTTENARAYILLRKKPHVKVSTRQGDKTLFLSSAKRASERGGTETDDQLLNDAVTTFDAVMNLAPSGHYTLSVQADVSNSASKEEMQFFHYGGPLDPTLPQNQQAGRIGQPAVVAAPALTQEQIEEIAEKRFQAHMKEWRAEQEKTAMLAEISGLKAELREEKNRSNIEAAIDILLEKLLPHVIPGADLITGTTTSEPINTDEVTPEAAQKVEQAVNTIADKTSEAHTVVLLEKLQNLPARRLISGVKCYSGKYRSCQGKSSVGAQDDRHGRGESLFRGA